MDIAAASNSEVITIIRGELRERADPVRAAGAQAYMKSTLPCLGVRVPDVRRIVTAAVSRSPFMSGDQLRNTTLELWRGAAYREERYAAIDLTGDRLVAADPAMLPVYEEIISTGAWWDLADGVAGRVCGLLQAHRPEMTAVILRWSTSPDLWLRRASITSQLKARGETDNTPLEQGIVANLADHDFFIRKAVGWALREYAKTSPEWVAGFVAEHAEAMSPLSRREALRGLTAAGRN